MMLSVTDRFRGAGNAHLQPPSIACPPSKRTERTQPLMDWTFDIGRISNRYAPTGDMPTG
jgi:hypothetical protein